MDAQAAPLARWRVKPRLEESIQTLEHLFVEAPNVRKTAPKGEIQFLSHTLEFRGNGPRRKCDRPPCFPLPRPSILSRPHRKSRSSRRRECGNGGRGSHRQACSRREQTLHRPCLG